MTFQSFIIHTFVVPQNLKEEKKHRPCMLCYCGKMKGPVMLDEKFCLQEYYPENEEIIYRYLTFDKFKDLISSKKLYLSRGDRFKDKYEGIETAFGTNLRRAIHDDQNFEINSKLYERNRRCVAISCWFIGDRESESIFLFLLWKTRSLFFLKPLFQVER